MTGKGDKKRSVSIPVEVLRLIETHLADQKELGFADDYSSQAGRSHMPLIRVLGDTVETRQYESHDGDPGTSIATAAVARRQYADSQGALGPAAMQRLVKALFSQCAEKYSSRGRDKDKFQRASLHWSGIPWAPPWPTTESISGLFRKGHASINTTAKYSTKNEQEMVRQLRIGSPCLPARQRSSKRWARCARHA